MRRCLLTAVGALLAGVGLAAVPAIGEEYRLSTDFGPVTLQVNEAQGTVFGVYPKYNGRIYADVQDRGSITGIWVQPSGDHPCTTLNRGQANWGWMHFSRPHAGLVHGSWGYCDGPMNQEWNGITE